MKENPYEDEDESSYSIEDRRYNLYEEEFESKKSELYTSQMEKESVFDSDDERWLVEHSPEVLKRKLLHEQDERIIDIQEEYHNLYDELYKKTEKLAIELRKSKQKAKKRRKIAWLWRIISFILGIAIGVFINIYIL